MIIVAVRDRKRRKVERLLTFDDAKAETAKRRYAEFVAAYDPRHYEVLYVRADSLESFRANYPRYAKGLPTKGE